MGFYSLAYLAELFMWNLLQIIQLKGFLLPLRRFVSVRSYPSKLYSDPGTQLSAADKELKMMVKDLDWETLRDFGAEAGMEWKFTPADAPWQNGFTEAMVKGVKKALKGAIGEQVLSFSELQTVFSEAANLVNERPIGRHPTEPEETSYLSPNHLLLGRASSRVPGGPFEETDNPKKRFLFIQTIIGHFWKRWIRDYFPTLLIQQKWHTDRRNVQLGDIVLIQDSNDVRGKWKLGRVSKCKVSDDGKVRRVEVQYKIPRPNERMHEYKGRPYTTVERAVQKLVVILPADGEE